MMAVRNIPIALIALGLPLAAMGSAAFAAPDEPAVAASTPADTHRFTLLWKEPVTVIIEAQGDELIVRFDKRIDEAAARAFANAAASRVDRFDWAYDQLVLTPAAGWTVHARTLPGGFEARFTPAPAAVTEAAGAPGAGDDTALLAAQADAASGFPGRARRQLAKLGQDRPGDKAVQQALAEAELASYRPVAAARRYAAIAGPDAPPQWRDAARRADLAAGASVEPGLLVRDSKTFDQQEYSLLATAPLADDVVLFAGGRMISTQVSEVATATGIRTNAKDTAGLARIGARVATGALRIGAELVARGGPDIVGAQMTVAHGEPEAHATFRLGYHLPDMQSAEGAILGGWADRIALGGFIRPVPALGLRIDGGLVRYGLRGEGARARTATLETAVDYLVRRQNPAIALSYRIEAEYLIRRDLRGNGLAYLPLDDRENHTGEVVINQPLGRALVLTGAGGWTFDRFGGDGPSASLGLALNSGGGWEGTLTGGVSSISRPGEPQSSQTFLRAALVHRMGGTAP